MPEFRKVSKGGNPRRKKIISGLNERYYFAEKALRVQQQYETA
jgi:hypothetical protein